MWKYKLKEYKIQKRNALNMINKNRVDSEPLEFFSDEKYRVTSVKWLGDSEDDEIYLEGYILKNDSRLINFILKEGDDREFEIELERTIEDVKEQITCKRIKLVEFNMNNSNLIGLSEFSFCFKINNQNRISNSDEPIVNIVRKRTRISRGRFQIRN